MNDFATFKSYTIGKVAEFITAFDASKDVNLWIKLVLEEGIELLDATDPENELKEAADFAYVVAGMSQAEEASNRVFTKYEAIVWKEAIAAYWRIRESIGDEKFIEAFNRVHASNMSKLGDDGKPIRREDGKILKGPNYKPANLSDLV